MFGHVQNWKTGGVGQDYRAQNLQSDLGSIPAQIIKKNVTHHAKRDLMGIAECIDRGQTARTAQSDHGQYFPPLTDFLCIK